MVLNRDHEIASLRREISRLRRHMEVQVRDNERIWAGFQRIEIQIIGAQSFEELGWVLAREFRRSFPQVDSVTLACLDPDFELARLLSSSGSGRVASWFVPLTKIPSADVLPVNRAPFLGKCSLHQHAEFFPGITPVPASVAIAPLWVQGRYLGTLNQGSRDPQHFSAANATDLLMHLAAVTAMCIENTVYRERLRIDGLTDALTGVANRRFFQRRLSEEVNLWSRHRHALACLLLDLDRFKQVNDSHGHLIGDQVLQRVAMALAQGLRTSDVLARYGGEEFVLLLPGTGLDQALEVAARLRGRVAELVIPGVNATPVRPTVSIGLAHLPASGPMPENAEHWLLARADAALYQAKVSGRDRVAIADAAAPSYGAAS